MNAHEYLSDDGRAMLLLCSSLALPVATEAELFDFAPQDKPR